MLSAIHGLTLTYSGGQEHGYRRQVRHLVRVFGQGVALGIPVPILMFALLAALLGIGAGQDAVRTQGLRGGRQRNGGHLLGHPARPRRLHLLPHLRLLRGDCGLIQASRSMGSQNTVGQGLELEVLAAVILGGASLLGGSGTIFKTVIGVLILGFIQNGLLLVGLAILRPVRRDLDHHHPGGLARHRGQARKALVADRLRRTDMQSKLGANTSRTARSGASSSSN
jgi:ribose/xylose/arabinose/galactoside ABC-type transport system permease subunit